MDLVAVIMDLVAVTMDLVAVIMDLVAVVVLQPPYKKGTYEGVFSLDSIDTLVSIGEGSGSEEPAPLLLKIEIQKQPVYHLRGGLRGSKLPAQEEPELLSSLQGCI